MCVLGSAHLILNSQSTQCFWDLLYGRVFYYPICPYHKLSLILSVLCTNNRQSIIMIQISYVSGNCYFHQNCHLSYVYPQLIRLFFVFYRSNRLLLIYQWKHYVKQCQSLIRAKMDGIYWVFFPPFFFFWNTGNCTAVYVHNYWSMLRSLHWILDFRLGCYMIIYFRKKKKKTTLVQRLQTDDKDRKRKRGTEQGNYVLCVVCWISSRVRK